MSTVVFQQLAALPLSVLSAALRSIGLPAGGSKVDQVNLLADAVRLGKITVSQVLATSPGSASKPAPAAAPAAPTVPDPRIDATAAAAARAESVALDAGTMAAQASRDVAAVESGLAAVTATFDARLSAVTESLAKMAARTPDDIRTEVTASIQSAVTTALAPVLAAAQANGTEAAVLTATAGPVARRSALDVFGVDVTDRTGAQVMVECWDHPDAPAVDPHFIWTDDILSPLLLAADDRAHLWMGGEKGTGKTQTAMQFAARTGRAFTRVNFHKFTTTEEYIGSVGLVNGATEFVCGPLLRSYCETPGSITLLDEVTNCDPGELAPLNGLLEPGGRVSIGGRSWSAAPGALVLAADNTLGGGDVSGRYAGVRVMNTALLDRFSLKVAFTFLPLQKEIDAIVGHTGCAPALAREVMRVVTTARSKAQTGEIVDAPSIRQVCAWIRAMRRLPVRRAWDITIAASQPPESALAVEALYVAEVKEAAIDTLLAQ